MILNAEERGDYVELSIADDGAGIAAERVAAKAVEAIDPYGAGSPRPRPLA